MAEDRLVRFAVGPEGRITPDVAARLPGRGAWVEATRSAVESAVRRNGFARALKRQVVTPDGLSDQTEALLARRCLDHLGMGRRAGAIAAGFANVEAAIRDGSALALIEAADGAADGRGKLLRLAHGLGRLHLPLVGCFTAEEIGVALGRDPVVHACWLQEGLARKWATDTGRLAGFRDLAPASWLTDLTAQTRAGIGDAAGASFAGDTGEGGLPPLACHTED
jgi:hypothetical protein